MNSTTLSPQQQAEVKQLITAYAGLSFTGSRARSLDCALLEFHRNRKGLNLHMLSEHLKADESLLSEVIEYLLVHETYFFRESECLKALIQRITAASQNQTTSSQPVRIWSAGCSTGEEAYSLAILLSHSTLGSQFDIIASDISEQSLKIARDATYSEWSLRGVNEVWKEEHFVRLDSRYRLKQESISKRVTFIAANLAAGRQLPNNWYPLDAIVCRNVLIYFDRPQIAAAAKLFFDCMKEGGHLLTGVSDPALAEFADFEVESTEHGIIYRRPAKKTTSMPVAKLNTPEPIVARRVIELSMPPVPNIVISEEAVLEKARASYNKGDWNQVILTLSGHSGKGLAILVKSLLNLAQAREAVHVATEASNVAPLREEAHLLTALALMDLKDYRSAVERAKQAIFLDRTFIYAHFLLGVAHSCLKDRDQAIRSLNNARSLLSQLGPDEPIKLAEDCTHEHFAADIRRYSNLIESWSLAAK